MALAVTNREGFVLASKALEGNPYDGHTLDTTIGQVIAMTAAAVRKAETRCVGSRARSRRKAILRSAAAGVVRAVSC